MEISFRSTKGVKGIGGRASPAPKAIGEGGLPMSERAPRRSKREAEKERETESFWTQSKLSKPCLTRNCKFLRPELRLGNALRPAPSHDCTENIKDPPSFPCVIFAAYYYIYIRILSYYYAEPLRDSFGTITRSQTSLPATCVTGTD